MSHFRVIARHVAASGGGSGTTGTTPTTNPALQGTPREGQTAWVYPGAWPNTVNALRFTIYHDSSVVGTSGTQPVDGYNFDWPAGQSGYQPSVTVAASTDNGGSWSAEFLADNDFVYPSDYITPASIVLTGSRTSTSGTTPMVFTAAGNIFPCYRWLLIKTNASNVETYRGYKAVSENEISTGTMDPLSGSSDPAPDSPLPAVSVGETLYVYLTTPDYAENLNLAAQVGLISNPLAFTPTDGSSGRYAKLTFYSSSTITEVRLLDGSGVNWLVNCPFTVDGNPPDNSSTSRPQYHVNDGDPATMGGFFSQVDLGTGPKTQVDIIFDLLVKRTLHDLYIHTHPTETYAISSHVSLALSDNPASFPAPVVDVSGLTWGVNEDKHVGSSF